MASTDVSTVLADLTNPYSKIVFGLNGKFYPTPAAGWETRLWIQVALLALTVVLGTIYLVGVIVQLRSQGKPFRLVRLQANSSSVRLISLNALWLYVFFESGAAVVLIAYRFKVRDIFLYGGSQHNYTLIQFHSWTTGFFAGLVFTFTNASAALQVRKGAVYGTSAWTVWLHNGVLIGTIVAFLGCHIPLTCIANYHNNKLFQHFLDARSAATDAALAFAQSPESVTPAMKQAIGVASAGLSAEAAKTLLFSRIDISLLIGFVLSFALSSLASWSFVMVLRKQSRYNYTRDRQALSSAIYVSREQKVTIDGGVPPLSSTSHIPASSLSSVPAAVDAKLSSPEIRFDLPASTSSPGQAAASPFAAFHTKQAKNARFQAQRDSEDLALENLAANLSISVPIICVLCTYFTLSGILGLSIGRQSPLWSWHEFGTDGYSWAQIIAVNSVLIAFNWRLYVQKVKFVSFGSSTHANSGESNKNAARFSSGVNDGPKNYALQLSSLPKVATDSHADLDVMHTNAYSGATYKQDQLEEDDLEKKGHPRW